MGRPLWAETYIPAEACRGSMVASVELGRAMGDVSASALVGAGRPAFGALPRQHRQAAVLSQEALAERAGLSVDAIGVIERGKRGAPRPDTIALLAQALDLYGDEAALSLSPYTARFLRGQPRDYFYATLPRKLRL